MGPNDYRLDITHYDFSISHPDFNGIDSDIYTWPEYVYTPFGAWLAVSNSPVADTFSDWFREKTGTNIVLPNIIVLKNDPAEPVPTHR